MKSREAREYLRQIEGGEPEAREPSGFRGYQQPGSPSWDHEDEYIYQDANGRHYLKVVRTKPKGFFQMKWDGREWRMGKPDGAIIPYCLPLLLEALPETILFVTEGEKDADRLNDAGLLATTAPGGAGKWSTDLDPWIEKFRQVVILQDNDRPGELDALKKARHLSALGCEVRIVGFPEMPEHSDVSDWLDDGGTLEKLAEKVTAAPIFHAGPSASTIKATPYPFTDPKKLPRRDFVYGRDYIRAYVSLLIAPGGVGKSSLVIAEALSMVSGRALLGLRPKAISKVWIWNGEDPMDELHRRIAAATKHFNLTAADLGDRLHVDSGRTMPMEIVQDDGRGSTINDAHVEQIIATIQDRGIDVFIVDPFVSTHTAPENDNTKIGQVARMFALIADRTNAAVMLVHHQRKTGGERGTVEDGRGASALLAAVRSARVINPMTKDEAERAGIDEVCRRHYFRADQGKANLTPPAEAADWFRLRSVDLENTEGVDWDQGDRVGVVTSFAYPRVQALTTSEADVRRILGLVASGGPWREDPRSSREPWVGQAVARAMVLDHTNPVSRRAISKLISDLLGAGLLERVERKDGTRNARWYVEVGPAAADVELGRGG